MRFFEEAYQLEEALVSGDVPHAFGGHVAYGCHTVPRPFDEIEVHVFEPVARAERALSVLEGLGAKMGRAQRERLPNEERTRLRWTAPVDVFFGLDPFREQCLERRCRLPIGGPDPREVHVLSAEDLLITLALTGHRQQWRDFEELVFKLHEQIDRDRVYGWLRRLIGKDDERYQRAFEVILRGW